MQPVSVLIVEDEEIWVRNLELSLQEIGFKKAGVARTVEEALSAFKTVEFDIAIIDIYFNGQNMGIELGRILSGMYGKPFIFMTASEGVEEHQDAAAAKPAAYLVKPVNTLSLMIALQNITVKNNLADSGIPVASGGDTFFVKHGNKYKKIYWSDVVYLSAGKNYLTIFNSVDHTEYYIRSSLQKALQQIIPQTMLNFVQVNRSEAVQLPFITEMEGDEVKTGYRSFVISESFSRDVKKKLNLLS